METETQIIKFEIKRESSQYNKYLKWHIICYREDGSMLSSEYTTTKKIAYQKVCNDKKPLPIGNRLVKTNYVEI